MAVQEIQGVKASKLFNSLDEISALQIVAIVLLTWVAIYLIRRILPYVADKGPNKARLYVLGAVPIIRLGLLLTAAALITPIIFNVTFKNFLVIAGAAGVAIGLGLKDYVSNLIGGVVAIIEKPYRPGDWVRVDNDYGEVRHVGLRAVSLVTPADDVVSVPNQKLWSTNVANANDGASTLMCIAHFYLEPLHDAEAVRQSLISTARTSAYLHYDKSIFVMIEETPYATHYQLKAYPFRLLDQFRFITDLTVRGKQALADLGVSPATMPYTSHQDRAAGKSSGDEVF